MQGPTSAYTLASSSSPQSTQTLLSRRCSTAALAPSLPMEWHRSRARSALSQTRSTSNATRRWSAHTSRWVGGTASSPLHSELIHQRTLFSTRIRGPSGVRRMSTGDSARSNKHAPILNDRRSNGPQSRDVAPWNAQRFGRCAGPAPLHVHSAMKTVDPETQRSGRSTKGGSNCVQHLTRLAQSTKNNCDKVRRPILCSRGSSSASG